MTENQEIKLVPPLVEVILGSNSDIGVVDESGLEKRLRASGVPYRFSILSAHRHKDELRDHLGDDVFRSGYMKAIICVASMSAQLPGAVAAELLRANSSPIVLGAPLVAADGFLGGLDAVVAMMRMPPGVPVNICGIGPTGLANAAVTACNIVWQHFKEVQHFTLPARDKKEWQAFPLVTTLTDETKDKAKAAQPSFGSWPDSFLES